jgi:glycerol-3-phosphate cytidylyltransferase
MVCKSTMEKTSITYGTFDLYHIGHIKLFQRIKEFSSKLIVAVSTDEFNLSKGKKSIIPFENRFEIIKNLRCVDLVIPEESWDQKISDIIEYKVDNFIMGSDWEGKFDFLKKYCDVIYLPRTEGVSTTLIKNSISDLKNIKVESINSALNLLQQIRSQLS